MTDFYWSEKQALLSETDRTRRTVKEIEKDVDALRAEVRAVAETQQEILKAFRDMADKIGALHDEMFPDNKVAKPGLTAPRHTQ